MATKGAIAKENITNIIKQTFGDDFAGVVDKKIYLWADDGGEKVQIALSLTMPKTPIESVTSGTGSVGAFPSEDTSLPTELSAEDKASVEKLKALLGVS